MSYIFDLYDYIVYTIMLFSILFGLYRGAIKTILGLIYFVISIVITTFIGPHFFIYIYDQISDKIIASIISIIIGYIVSAIICSICNSVTCYFISPISGGAVDRSLGLLVGAMRGLVINALIFFAISIVVNGTYIKANSIGTILAIDHNDNSSDWYKHSHCHNMLRRISIVLLRLIPEEILMKELPKMDEIIHNF